MALHSRGTRLAFTLHLVDCRYDAARGLAMTLEEMTAQVAKTRRPKLSGLAEPRVASGGELPDGAHPPERVQRWYRLFAML
ncbi:hypothetical protein KCP69_04930 [Salmonella enterica subsp. enterica]|nr:hypothetical protein KCP69_04930 [Salmonella enterica subsp. enterica]